MKIRNGFISNSSSSSFIVIWDKKPESKEEIKEILFKDKENIYFDSYYGSIFSTIKLAETIFNDTDEITDEDILRNFNFSLLTYDTNNIRWDTKGYKEDEVLLKKYKKTAIKLSKELDDVYDKLYQYDHKQYVREIKLKSIQNKKLTGKILEYSNLLDKRKYLTSAINENENLLKTLNVFSLQEFKKDFKDKFVAHYEYDDKSDAVLEQGGIFDNIKHFYFNHH